MVLLSEVVERHQGELERLHGAQLLPSHRQALQAMRCCRRQGGDLMVLQCGDCHHSLKVPHSCGHRSCPHWPAPRQPALDRAAAGQAAAGGVFPDYLHGAGRAQGSVPPTRNVVAWPAS